METYNNLGCLFPRSFKRFVRICRFLLLARSSRIPENSEFLFVLDALHHRLNASAVFYLSDPEPNSSELSTSLISRTVR